MTSVKRLISVALLFVAVLIAQQIDWNTQIKNKPNFQTTIFSGSIALSTSAIAGGVCTSTQTVSATGVTTTTDHLIVAAASDPTIITGYGPSIANGNLEIWYWLTTNQINVKVCNPNSNSITPGALSLSLGVTR